MMLICNFSNNKQHIVEHNAIQSVVIQHAMISGERSSHSNRRFAEMVNVDIYVIQVSQIAITR